MSSAELCPTDGVATLSTEGSSLGIAALSVGSVLGGRYVLERLIGRGGFGAVFAARHTGTGQGVAIKTLTAGLENDERALRRFFQEARVTAGLKHPNTIRVFDFGQDGSGILFLAMELLTGVTLRTELKGRLEQGRVFSEREAIDVGEAICRSLAEAHAAGLVHRDLKPDNIFLHRVDGDDPLVKVLDFGIVKSPDSSLTLGSDSSAPGTPAYMSPEQVRQQTIDGRSDLYSLGVILFAMVTGTVPFRGQDALQTIYMHVHEPLPDIRARARTPLSPAFVQVIERTLAKAPADRPADARELRRLLQACREGAGAGSDPAAPLAPAPLTFAPSDTPVSGPGVAAPLTAPDPAAARRSRRLIGALWAGTAVALTLAGWLLLQVERPRADAPVGGAEIGAPASAAPATPSSTASSPPSSAPPIAASSPPSSAPPIAAPSPPSSAIAAPAPAPAPSRSAARPKPAKGPPRARSPKGSAAPTSSPPDVLDLKI